MQRVLRLVVLVVGLLAGVWVTLVGATDPAVLLGVPRPSAVPTCGSNRAGYYGDPNACLYVCAGTVRALVAKAGDAACVFPTNTP